MKIGKIVLGGTTGGYNLIINPYRAHFYIQFQLICDL